MSTDFLRKFSWFEDLDQRSLEAIANAAVEQRFEPGQEIMRQGDVGVGAFIIRSGKVEVLQDRDGKQVKLATLGPRPRADDRAGHPALALPRDPRKPPADRSCAAPDPDPADPPRRGYASGRERQTLTRAEEGERHG